MKHVKQYIFNLLIAIDQLANTLLAGDPDETISSRVGKYVRRGSGSWLARVLNRFLAFFQRDHCVKSIEDDEGKNEVI